MFMISNTEVYQITCLNIKTSSADKEVSKLDLLFQAEKWDFYFEKIEKDL